MKEIYQKHGQLQVTMQQLKVCMDIPVMFVIKYFISKVVVKIGKFFKKNLLQFS
jgi:hypothetical protein